MNKALVLLPVKDEHKHLLETAAPTWRFIYNAKPGADDVTDAAAIIGNVAPSLLRETRALKLLQLNSAGCEPYVDGALPIGAALCNASGAYGVAISEHILGMLLALLKKLYLYHDNQAACLWRDEGPVRPIYASNALIVGAGDIGLETAKRLHAFGARVTALRRTRLDERPEGVDALRSIDCIDEELPKADIVLLSLPGNAQTRGLIGRERLALMKPTALLLNVGRGALIDTEALCDALEAGRLGGAALDVTDPEPLPADHRLWRAPNCAITPHVSGFFHLQETFERIVRIAARNLAALDRGEKLENRIDPATGETIRA